MTRKAFRLIVRGTVQGVGFRPFIYRLASRLGFSGFVRNIGEGVEIYLEKEGGDLTEFLESLRTEVPPLARIEEIDYQPVEPLGRSGFEIDRSSQEKSFVFISPDIATCPDCLREVEDPKDRRYGYPFTNCTSCGPRYTIVRQLPYDRHRTTMSGFRMCPDCQREYQDPLDRRYHAQPIACPRCGPELSLLEARTGRKIPGGLKEAVNLIKKGKILAVKGLGGFHLVCLATDQKAIKRLRQIKRRQTKPLALMARDLETVKKYAKINPDEKNWLTSPSRPIVLLKKKRELPGIAPSIDTVGIMLPYTPLHHLLLKDLPLIVATSSNRKDAPIVKDDSLIGPELCDYILTHNREIAMRADDSVIKVVNRRPVFFRRARGFVPFPQPVPKSLNSPVQVLAVGGELKNTISIYKNGYIITSQFLGDLDDYENFRYFEETLSHLKRLFSFRPDLVVSDLHPDFWSTRYARNLKLPHLKVQHHYAHSLAPLIEHQLHPGKKFLGVSWDGFGYGDDGQAWGGEFLLADYDGYERYAHFDYVQLPGGDAAAREPWRIAVAHLYQTFGPDFPRLRPLRRIPENKLGQLRLMMEKQINSPLTSSAGRLFDAVAFICGLAPARVEYEAEAPSRLEAAASRVMNRVNRSYSFSINRANRPYLVDFSPTFTDLISDLNKKIPPELAAWKFHLTLVRVILEMAILAREEHGLNLVVLTGGVFLNRILTEQAERALRKNGFEVLRPVLYSPGDESLSLGQIAYALNKVKRERI
ncbi:MAG: carbamoyltransferase HypF [Candidatus Saccharicenans sp.]|nr:carbamoyltransferase HypF [Candidatus Saccharicenans sp.]